MTLLNIVMVKNNGNDKRRGRNSHSIVVPSDPSTNSPLMKMPVENEVLPLYVGVFHSYENVEGIMESKIRGMIQMVLYIHTRR